MMKFVREFHSEIARLDVTLIHHLMVRKLNRPVLGFLTMNCGDEELHMVRVVA